MSDDTKPQAGATKTHVIRVTSATIREDDDERDVYDPGLPDTDEVVEYLRSQTGDEGKPWWVEYVEALSVGAGRGIRITVEGLSTGEWYTLELTPEELARQGAGAMLVTERAMNHVVKACRRLRDKECAE